MTGLIQTHETWANDLNQLIKGYQGYRLPADRSQSDQRLREFLCEKLQQVEIDLSQFEHRFYQHHKSANLSPFHRISLSLKMLIQSLIEPSPNTNPFWGQSNITEDKIAQLNVYDVQLVNQVDILIEEVKELENTDGEYEVDEVLNHFYDLIDGVNQILSERDFLMMSE